MKKLKTRTMFKLITIFAMRLSVFDGINRQSITSDRHVWWINGLGKENTRYAVKQSRVSFFNLIIPSPYRWLVKRSAQLQVTLVGSDRCSYWNGRTLLGTFSFSFLLGVFFSLSFKSVNPMRTD